MVGVDETRRDDVIAGVDDRVGRGLRRGSACDEFDDRARVGVDDDAAGGVAKRKGRARFSRPGVGFGSIAGVDVGAVAEVDVAFAEVDGSGIAQSDT